MTHWKQNLFGIQKQWILHLNQVVLNGLFAIEILNYTKDNDKPNWLYCFQSKVVLEHTSRYVSLTTRFKSKGLLTALQSSINNWF